MSHEVVDSNANELVYTLDEALEVVGFGKFQVLVLAYAGLGVIAEAMEVMILSFIGPAVKSDWGLSSGQESLITTMVFAGMLIGNYSWGVIADNYGRRLGLLSVAPVTSMFALFSAFSPNYISLVLFRVVVGFGLGGGPIYSAWFLEFVPVQNQCFWMVIYSGVLLGLLSVAAVTSMFALFSAFSPNYISLVLFRVLVGFGLGGGPVYSAWFLEFVPVQNRGFWMVIFSTFWTVGTILEAALAWIVMPSLGWRWLLVLSSVPCFAALTLYFLTIESPRYLYMHGRINDVHNILKKMAAINQTELPSGMLVSDQIAELAEEFSHNSELLSSREKPGFSSLLTLLSRSLIKTTLLMWVVFFGNSFSYYGVVLLTSESSSGKSNCGSGSNSVLSKLTDSSLYRNVFITSFAEVPGLVLSGILVDKIGRKISMAVMYLFAFIFLLPLIFHLNEVLTTTLLFGARMCTIGTYTVAGVYCPEIYPTSVRATGVGVATGMSRIAGMICPLVAVQLVSSCHQMAAIVLFEVVLILAGISVLFFPIETKGRELNDIAVVKN